MSRRAFPYLLILSFLLLGISCGNRPSNVLSEKKMVSLLADMEIAEAYVNTQGSSSNDERIEIGKRVLQAHGVSEETLDTTLAWYGRNMDDYASLFDKVDKEIIKRQKKYSEMEGTTQKIGDNLWPYGSHLVLSPLSGHDALSFSLSNPEMESGDLLVFSFFLPNNANVKSTLGVEYSDGHGEALYSNYSSKKKLNLELQTDTGRKVSRIFGIMHLKDIKDLPLYIDSISLETIPYDSLSYRSKRRSQKTFDASI